MSKQNSFIIQSVINKTTDNDFMSISQDKMNLNIYLSTIHKNITIEKTKSIYNEETYFNDTKFILNPESLNYIKDINDMIDKKFGNIKYYTKESIEDIPLNSNSNSSSYITLKTIIIIRKTFLKVPSYLILRLLIIIFIILFILYVIYILKDLNL